MGLKTAVATNAKTLTPETAVAATDRLAFGDVSADGWAVIQAQKLAKALAAVSDDSAGLRAALGLGSLAEVTPTGTPDGTKFLRDDGSWQSAGGGLTIGGTVTGGTAGRVLYVGSGPVLAEDAGTVAITVGPRTVQGTLTVRQTGGAAGTDELQIGHDGAKGVVESKDGPIVDISADGTHRFRRGSAPANDLVQIVSASGVSGVVVGYSGIVAVVGGEATIPNATTVATAYFSASVMQLPSNGTFGFTPTSSANGSSDTRLKRAASAVIAVTDGGTGTNPGLRLQRRSSTTDDRDVAGLNASWVDDTDATRLGRLALSVYSTTTAQEGVRIEANSAGVRLGFFGGAAAAKPAVTGSRGGNAALASLLTALATLGLLTDSTTA